MVAAVALTLVGLGGLLAWRVAQEPISVGFLIPYVSEALALPQFGIRAEMADLVLAWSERDQSLRLRVVDARYRGADERVALRIPFIDMALSGPSLLRGVIAPRYVFASGIEARLVRDAQGRFQIGLPLEGDGQPGATTEAEEIRTPADTLATGMFAGVFELLSRRPDPNDPLSQLQMVSMLAERLVIEDWKLNQRWVVPGAQLSFRRGDGHVYGSATGALDWRDRRVNLTVGADYDAAERAAKVDVQFDNVEPSDFADVVPELQPLDYLSAPLNGSLTLRLNESGEQLGLNFDLHAGAGRVQAPDFLVAPLELTEARFRGYADAANGRLYLDEGSISFADNFRLSFGGWLSRSEGERYGLDLKGQFFDLPTSALAQYWPPGMARNARDWVTTRISEGRVSAGRFAAALTPAMLAGEVKLPREAVKLDFAFEGLQVDYLPPMTKLRDGKGAAAMDADVFDLSVESATVNLPGNPAGNLPGGSLQVGPGSVKITGLQAVDQHAEITSTARGKSSDVLALIDQKPLGFPSRLAIKPAGVGGEASVTWRLKFPLLNALKTDDVAVTAEADLTALSMDGLMGRYGLTEGDMKLKVDAKALEASGKAALNGVPLQIVWRQEFSARAAVPARYRLQGRIDEAQRKVLGYPLAPYIDGPVEATMEIEERRGGETAIGGEFDLKDAVISVAEAHLEKPAGIAGQGRVLIRTRAGQPVSFDLIELEGPALSGRAKAQLNSDGGWSAEIASLKTGDSDARGRISYAANGDARIELSGRRYDLRPFVKDVFDDDAEPGQVKPRLILELRLDEARIDDELEMRNLALNVQREPKRLERVGLTGGFATTGGVTFFISPALNGRSLRLDSDNAGAMLHFLGVTNMQGGTMQINAAYDDTQASQPLAGRMMMQNVRAVRAPFLARLLGIGSFAGLSALLSGEGILFETGEVPFTQKDGVLTLRPSRLQGPQLGITFEGNIYDRTDSISVTGTAVPAFVLNTILGKIPLLGDLFVGDGIIGVNFAVSGNRSDPQFTVNPLSAIAPGFLRRIFQAPTSDSNGQQGPQSPPSTEVPFEQRITP
ncbi:AsmA-like C-terminal domain-containing protein [Ferrovibrio sp.]|uniref:YhdP family protein n=1 Tax=Ferrovibrio sp. TaxID=1917215 RepID=UPI002637A5D4|nr:AsmA-like C-terminal domain-containing protein [Ferrovibrio sp.]